MSVSASSKHETRATWIIIALVSALLVALWALFNRPDTVPPWPESIRGVAFSPFRAGQSPESQKYPTPDQITADLTLLSDRVRSVRTYSVAGTLLMIPQRAHQLGLKVTVGIWLTDDLEQNRIEIDKFKSEFHNFGWNVTGVIVGNEVLLRKELTPKQLSTYLDEISDFVGIVPVTTAETWDQWQAHPELAEHVDYIAIHVLPYWEGIPLSHASDYVFTRYIETRRLFPNKRVVLGEVGWPSDGRQRGGAIPSLQNQAKFLRHFLHEAERREIHYFVMEAFDQVWKSDEGSVGRYWGFYNAERRAKFPFTAPITRIPDWPALAVFSLALALLLLALVLRDSRGLDYSGRGFLVLMSYAISSFVVWLVYDYSTRYLTWDQVAVGVWLLVAVLCICAVLLAEAHEWAETIWRKIAPQRDNTPAHQATNPKVSIHVPIYNEPPELVLETLSALNQLNYQNFEVIVVDNNTNEEAVWKPVQQWCSQQSHRFKFFHVNPLSGFKAGALNYALSKTADDVDLVAVIDSDYVVDPEWLRDCTGMFNDEQVAIVQAPQDYRDNQQNAFKAMMYSEYAGFFAIGMVNRNARNAIIQHGTMTIVRKRALLNVDGWSEWCITEDAELGLRILAEGHRAVYIPKSYGRGLMPDNFLDYKKQRFRWAYGSVLIMRHHLRYLLGFGKSRLSARQCYHYIAGWLPWIADGMSLVFNCVAIAYSILMIYKPAVYSPPEVALCLLPIGFFLFKVIKMQALYHWRMGATLRQSLFAGLAGLAVSHTVSRAILAGFVTRDIGFFRTPKLANSHTLVKAFTDAREEFLLAIALTLSALAIGFREDAYLLDTKMWMLLLLVQSTTYYAAVAVSMISALANLPARLVDKKPESALVCGLKLAESVPPTVQVVTTQHG